MENGHEVHLRAKHPYLKLDTGQKIPLIRIRGMFYLVYLVPTEHSNAHETEEQDDESKNSSSAVPSGNAPKQPKIEKTAETLPTHRIECSQMEQLIHKRFGHPS